MVSASTLAIISLPFIGLAAVFILAVVGPPEGYDFGPSSLSNQTNNKTNSTKPVQTYNFPKVNKTQPTFDELIRRNVTIGEFINMTRSNAGFIYPSLAAEEERPEPWALLAR